MTVVTDLASAKAALDDLYQNALEAVKARGDAASVTNIEAAYSVGNEWLATQSDASFDIATAQTWLDDMTRDYVNYQISHPLLPPTVYKSTTVASAATINNVAETPTDRQLTLAGEGSAIPFHYGEPRVGGLLLNFLPYQQWIVVQILWGYALDSVNDLYVNAKPAVAGRYTNYTGSQNTVDPTLEAAFAAQSPAVDYNDTLNGYAYSVVKIPAADFNGMIDITARVKGRLVYDPRGTPGTRWSDNPALCLADFLSNTTYGLGIPVDSTSLATAADACDAQIGSPAETRRKLSIAFREPALVKEIVETLRTYAGCFVIPDGNQFKLLVDGVASPCASYAHADGTIASISPRKKADLGNIPTVMEIRYTDTSSIPNREGVARKQLDGVTNGTLPRRVSSVQLPGITRYSQAYREAIERLNKLNNDLTFTLGVFDSGIKHQIGDVISVTYPGGLDAKYMRIGSPPGAVSDGIWQYDLTEYDDANYSTVVQTAPTYVDTTFDDPVTPPSVSIALDEEVYQLENGLYSSRLRATITPTPASYMWLLHYEVETWVGAVLIDSGTTTDLTYATPPVQEDVSYLVRVRAKSVVNAVGAWGQQSKTALGKALPPTWPDGATLSGFEVGGDVYLSWPAAEDIDVYRYEVAYSETGVNDVTQAIVLDRVDALRFIIKGAITAGEWTFYVRAMDSVGNYTEAALTKDIVVTLDPNALQLIADVVMASTTGMLEYKLARTDPLTYWRTNKATDTVGGIFTSNMGTYTNPLYTYVGDVASSWTSDWYDAGQDFFGDWQAALDYTVDAGAVHFYIDTATAAEYPGSYTSTEGSAGIATVKTLARHARIRIVSAANTARFRVTSSLARITCNAVGRKESDCVEITTASTGITITLKGHYAHLVSLQVSAAKTNAFATAVWDALTLHPTNDNTFVAYLFNATPAKITGWVSYTFEGI